jgi:predicted DNA-binding WGR domain protein
MTISRDLQRLAQTRLACPITTEHVTRLARAHRQLTADDHDAFRLASFHDPRITRTAWDEASPFRKFAALAKLANRPIMEGLGLNARKVSAGEAFMVYFIDQEKNHSKFYEGLIIEEGGGFRVIRRWGALTDSGRTGKIDGAKFDHDNRFWFEDLRAAKRELAAHYKKRVSRGYTDAWTHAGAKGQYPVGLKRDVGFGWGTQSVAFCIPALRECQTHLNEAKTSLSRGDFYRAADALQAAQRDASQVGRADSSMGNKIRDNIDHMGGRSGNILSILQSGDMPDRSEVKNWGTALSRLISYIDKQLAVCHAG